MKRFCSLDFPLVQWEKFCWVFALFAVDRMVQDLIHIHTTFHVSLTNDDKLLLHFPIDLSLFFSTVSILTTLEHNQSPVEKKFRWRKLPAHFFPGYAFYFTNFEIPNEGTQCTQTLSSYTRVFYEENLIDCDLNDTPFHIVIFDEKIQTISNNSLWRRGMKMNN